jgi:hypothetical protein
VEKKMSNLQRLSKRKHPRKDQRRQINTIGLGSAYLGLLISVLMTGFAGDSLNARWLQIGLVGSGGFVALAICVPLLSRYVCRALLLEITQALTLACVAVLIWIGGWMLAEGIVKGSSELIVLLLVALFSILVGSTWSFRASLKHLANSQSQLAVGGKLDHERKLWDVTLPLETIRSKGANRSTPNGLTGVMRWLVAFAPFFAQVLLKGGQLTPLVVGACFVTANILMVAVASRLAAAVFLRGLEQQIGQHILVPTE